VVAIGLVTAGLSGCTVEKESPVYPELRWDGSAPTGPLEEDPWVQAARAELTAEAVARNRNDFSIPELARTATAGYRDRLSADASRVISNHGGTKLFPGPLPFAPTTVEVGYWNKGGDFAAVRGCVAARWATESGVPTGEIDGVGIEYRLERDHDGVMRVGSTSSLPDLACGAVGPLPTALFDPVPEPSGVTEVRDLVRPDGTTSGPRSR
jgi:hypothetical protein